MATNAEVIEEILSILTTHPYDKLAGLGSSAGVETESRRNFRAAMLSSAREQAWLNYPINQSDYPAGTVYTFDALVVLRMQQQADTLKDIMANLVKSTE